MKRSLKANDFLRTPEWVWKPLGEFDLDPCASPLALIAKNNLTLEAGDDGLSAEWFGYVFCNPPFSQKELWGRKMVDHGNGILILPERGSAPWCGPLLAAAGYYFVMGKRINFIGGSSSNNIGSILIPFGEKALDIVARCGHPGTLNKVLKFTDRSGVTHHGR